MYRIEFLLLTIMFSSSSVFSQSNLESEKRFQSGMSLSTNYSLLNSDVNSTIRTTHNGTGFGLGLLFQYSIDNALSLRFNPTLSINDSHVKWCDLEDDELTFERKDEVFPLSIDGILHWIWSLNKKDQGLYLITGLTGKIPLDTKTESSFSETTNPFVSVDIGLGLCIDFTVFKLCPEIRYSHAINSLNNRLTSKDLYMHQITLGLNFKG